MILGKTYINSIIEVNAMAILNIVKEGDFPIGNGYYMNDYIMSIEIV